MKFDDRSKNHVFNSYFLINKINKIVNFNIDHFKSLERVLLKNPETGQYIGEIIPHKYLNYFLKTIEDCFDGNSITINRKVKIGDKAPTQIQFIFTPVTIAAQPEYVSCTITKIDDPDKFSLNDYSQFTSHQIRAPITNILSLSNLINYPKLNSYDYLKISELLNDINTQAKRLDEILIMLNSIMNNDKNSAVFKLGNTRADINRIMLVDDDALTNKMHQMILSRYQKDKTVIAYSDPRSALNDVRKKIPDLIFLDINMPDIDGWKFLKIMSDYQIKVDVIILSSSIDPNEIIRAKSFPAVKDFIIKPLTYDKIKHLFAKD